MPLTPQVPAPEASLDRFDGETNSGPPQPEFLCDLCGERFTGAPFGSGLFVWTRGEEVRLEEPPLCEPCASRITVGALLRWESEESEG